MPPLTVSLAGRTAALAAIAGLLAHWFLQPIPLGFKTLSATLIIAAVARPALGLMTFAVLAPISTVLASLLGSAGMGAALLEQIALAIGAGAILRGGTGVRTRIGAPVLCLAAVAVASAAATIGASAWVAAPGVGEPLAVQQLWDRQAAQGTPLWAPLFAALVVVECALLAWSAERTVRQSPNLMTRLIAILLFAHAGAAALNLKAVVDAASGTSHPFEAFPQLLMSMRVSVQTDWNAGASALLLAGVAGVGLMKGSPLRRLGVGLLLAFVATGVWITGSRVAILCGVAAGVVATGWSLARRGGRARVMVVGLAVIAVAAATWVIVSNPAGRNDSVSRSATTRVVMFKAGVDMFKEAPVFGVGIARFYDSSTAFAGAYLTSVGWRPRENAHNNFLQVLAEQGLAGLGALLWCLAAILLGGIRAHAMKPDGRRAALLLAIAACVGTWLTGHPLLVPEFALVFWLYCGILAAWTPAVAPTGRRWALWILVAVVVLSVPLRAFAIRNAMDFEHRGSGLSLWQHDDAQRYREAGAMFTLWLQAGGRPVAVPIRRAPGAPGPMLVDVKIGDSVFGTLSIDGDEWRTHLLVVPHGWRRFEAVDFVVRPPVSGAPGNGVLLRIGKTAER